MNVDYHKQLCALCHQPAEVWCRQDHAYLCARCDQEVHSAGPLAWKHERIRLSDRRRLLDIDETNADTHSDRPDPANVQNHVRVC